MLDCVVIGAGPGGIVCTKELLEQDLNVICLERSDQLGGTFTTTYDNLILTSSTTFSMFSDFWITAENPNGSPGKAAKDDKIHHFWTKEEAVDYWNRYADHFAVTDHVRFNTAVNEVTPNGDGWNVQLASGETIATKRVAIATGTNRHPSFPKWKDKLTDVDYAHSADYQNAEQYLGKNVLMVGGGESGSDVAYQVSEVAKKSWVSLRSSTGWVVPRLRGTQAADIATHRGAWGLPREFGGALSDRLRHFEKAKGDPVHTAAAELNTKVDATHGIWGTYGTKTFALPRAMAHHNCGIVGEIVDVADGGRTAITADGERIEDLDAIIFSTGYKNYEPFLPTELQTVDPRALYKHMIHPDHKDRLVWIGRARPGFGSQFPIMELQARLFAQICGQRHQLPPESQMAESINADREKNLDQFEHNAERIRPLVDYFHYMDDLADIIGCKPPLRKYLLTKPNVWLRMVYGPAQATQYRLVGPGAKKTKAENIIRRLPTSSFNHMVKAGLKGRVKQLLAKPREVAQR